MLSLRVQQKLGTSLELLNELHEYPLIKLVPGCGETKSLVFAHRELARVFLHGCREVKKFGSTIPSNLFPLHVLDLWKRILGMFSARLESWQKEIFHGVMFDRGHPENRKLFSLFSGYCVDNNLVDECMKALSFFCGEEWSCSGGGFLHPVLANEEREERIPIECSTCDKGCGEGWKCFAFESISKFGHGCGVCGCGITIRRVLQDSMRIE